MLAVGATQCNPMLDCAAAHWAFSHRAHVAVRARGELHRCIAIHLTPLSVIGQVSESAPELQGTDPIGYACVKRSKRSKITCKGSMLGTCNEQFSVQECRSSVFEQLRVFLMLLTLLHTPCSCVCSLCSCHINHAAVGQCQPETESEVQGADPRRVCLCWSVSARDRVRGTGSGPTNGMPVLVGVSGANGKAGPCRASMMQVAGRALQSVSGANGKARQNSSLACTRPERRSVQGVRSAPSTALSRRSSQQPYASVVICVMLRLCPEPCRSKERAWTHPPCMLHVHRGPGRHETKYHAQWTPCSCWSLVHPGTATQLVPQPAMGNRLSAMERILPAVGCRLLAVGRRLPAVGRRLPAMGCKLLAVGCRLPATGFKLLAVGCRLPAAGSRLPVVGRQVVCCGLHVDRFTFCIMDLQHPLCRQPA
eukprot:155138-Chlamydomonas_euryale.AAC.4